ncbi:MULTISPECIES: IdeS/Mac family cysteine endopeptidase [unclassified Treponema]|uniref:IdeS/Mac family cysteine endopeptidase n=1 Tax=unclassified Treponema TaxID=2638727 RepID=UPI0020A2E53D|nr:MULTISPECIES: IdeS/Mac family cysteine endopeptidase [unclassified Treponema]UTC66982.1 hypothetical protein E4O06_13740 [Treponema sp. OMZ 789]UTC69712.1 hypothetical protein E4O01_13880 [Treponema sp. OMZ 790]UTC72426.1 hypothetical protein E4O02_13970 [Treponema sp. OMZ 791]
MNLELEPFSATNKNYTIKSDNTEIAWPDRVQGIRAQKAGTANIIVESESNPEVKLIIPIKVKKRPEIIVDDKPLNYGSSNPGQTSFAVKTLHGKLDYTPEIQGNVNWLTFTVDNSADDKDIINFKFAENKTPWDKIAYVKFKNKKTGKYIGKPEGRKNQKDFTVKIIQAKNTNPPNVKIRWVHGVTPPTESEKTRIKYNNDTQLAVPYAFTWTETASTNFFNARKASYVQPVTAGPAIPDTNACWAKTSTNMLHWWFEQNKENIEKYKKTLQGDTSLYDVSYDRSLPDSKESTKSSIASVFSKNFKNAGGDMFSGIKWYLYEQPLNYRPKAPALFKEIFNKDSGLIEQKSVHSKTEFENMIKNALDSKKAIGFAVRRDRDQFWHGITLWGAAFDAEDNVIAIYIADSNDSRNIINAWGIHYQDSPRKNPYIMRFDLNAYDKNLYIDTVITLDKGEEQFKKFFDTHK